MIKFLNIIHYPVFGGPHNRACRLFNTLKMKGYESFILIPKSEENTLEKLEKHCIPYMEVPLSRARASSNISLQLSFFKNLRRDINLIRHVIRDKRINFVLISGLVNPHGAFAGAFEHIPIVWQITDSRTPLLLKYILLRIVKKLADAVMFNGYKLRTLQQKKLLLKIPNYIYYPPVDTNCFIVSKERRSMIRKQLGLENNLKVIGTVANLNPQKGIEYFIKAASLIYKQVPNTMYLLVGAKYKSHFHYNQLIEKELMLSGVPKNKFVFTGPVSDVENFYSAMDVKLITSVPKSEGTTTTAMEAMACGIPIVATDVGAVNEVVKNDVTGFVVKPRCPKSIAQATIKLLKDDFLRKKMSKKARKTAELLYDVEVCAETHIRAFKAACKNKRFRK